MKIRLNILILCLILAAVSLVGCKGKKQSAGTEGKPAGPNIAQTVKVDSNAIEPKVEQRQFVATVNGVKIFKDDFDTRVEQQINAVQRQMPAETMEIPNMVLKGFVRG